MNQVECRRQLEGLKTWVQPQHLDKDALQFHRKSFEAHPARLVVLRNFLVQSIAERLATFLQKEADWHFEYGLYSTGDEPAVEKAWLNANDEDRFFRLSKLVGALPQYAMSPNMLTYLRFRKAFQTSDFSSFFEALSGLPLEWSDDFGSHAMKTGDFLKSHNDDNRNRSIALVIYLSPEWSPRFGGALNVIDRGGHITKIEAEYNSIVVFDVAARTTHFVNPIHLEAEDKARLTIGGWYRKPS